MSGNGFISRADQKEVHDKQTKGRKGQGSRAAPGGRGTVRVCFIQTSSRGGTAEGQGLFDYSDRDTQTHDVMP
jgi:hypothetical protein